MRKLITRDFHSKQFNFLIDITETTDKSILWIRVKVQDDSINEFHKLKYAIKNLREVVEVEARLLNASFIFSSINVTDEWKGQFKIKD
jgi:hypothetical protein